MGIWIRTGTVALSNGSPDVTGTGTGFLAAGVQPGYEFRDAAGVAYEVLSVTSDTLLTLTQTYAGATASGAAYTIVPMSYAANAAVFSKVMALLSMLSSNVQATSLKLGDPSIGDAVLAAKGLRHSFENSGDINLDVIKGAGTDEAFLRFLAGETVGGRIGLDAAGALVIDCGNGMRVPVLSEDPVDPANGSIWYLIGTNKFRCCENGTKRNLFGAESGTYEAGAGLALDDDTFSVAAGGVTRAMLADATALSVIGRSADSAGAPADIAIDANGKYIGRRGNAVGGYQIAAGEIANTAAGNIAATNVQAALNELDGDKQPTSAKLTALAALEGGAGKSVVFAGDDSFETYDTSDLGRSLAAAPDAAAARALIGVGEGGETTTYYVGLADGHGNEAAATSSEIIKFRTAAGLDAVVDDDDETHGDNVLFALDWPSLTADTAPDGLADLIATYDVSAAAHKKVTGLDMFWARCKATPQKVARLYTDFFTVPSTTEGDGGFNSVVSGTGAGVNASVNGVVAHPGVIVFTTGSTSTGRACVTSNATSIALGGAEFYLEIDLSPATAVSDGTNRYQVVVGFGDNDAGVGQTDGLFFYYQEGGSGLAGAANSANWQCVSSNNGSRTFTTTSVPFALAWSRFGVLVNAAANSVGFYIDGTLVATHTTNIPSGTGRQVAAMAALFKSVGTSARTLVLDYINLTGLLSTAR